MATERASSRGTATIPDALKVLRILPRFDTTDYLSSLLKLAVPRDARIGTYFLGDLRRPLMEQRFASKGLSTTRAGPITDRKGLHKPRDLVEQNIFGLPANVVYLSVVHFDPPTSRIPLHLQPLDFWVPRTSCYG
jgi:hypothetical protein